MSRCWAIPGPVSTPILDKIKQHLAEGELASSAALALGGDQVVRLPVLNQPGKIMEAAEQGNGRIRHEGTFRLCGTGGYRIRSCLIGEPPPQPHPRSGQPESRSHGVASSPSSLFPSGFPQHSTQARGSSLQSPCPELGFYRIRYLIEER